NVYRHDEDDATHSHQFTQINFVWVKKDLNLSNVKFIINGLIKHLFGQELNVRYRLSYFPFTEPSFEVDVECWKCKNHGCDICKQSGWISVGC
ncbi:MAG: phenylalanine--tRNA ligase subunit alpha, partial [Mycoplasma sp.]